MVKEAHNHTSIHLYIHIQVAQGGGADLLPARLGQLLRKWASLHRQTLTQPHPRQRDWRARNKIGIDQSQIDQIERARRVKATGVFSSWEEGGERERSGRGRLAHRSKSHGRRVESGTSNSSEYGENMRLEEERRRGLRRMELGRRLQEEKRKKESERGWSHIISQRRQVIIAHQGP